MGLEILVSSRQIWAELKNGTTFTLDPTNIATHLKGSVMEKVRATHSIDIAWNAVASQTDLWRTTLITNPITGIGNVTKIVRESGDFIDEGFADGDEINYTFNPFGLGSTFGGAFILIVNPTTIILDADIGAGVNTYGIIDSDGNGDSNFIMRGVTELTALKFKFGLPENSEAINFLSKVDGTEQSYYVKGIGLRPIPLDPRSTVFSIGESSEIFKSWDTGALKARFVNNPADFTQRFEIEHEFTILPYLKIDDAQAVFELTESLNSIRYVFEAAFRTVLSNPNTSKPVTDDFQKGSVATFGENFNGINTQYSLTSVSIVNALGDPINTLEVGTVNTVTAVIASNHTIPAFNTTDPFIIYHSFLPTSDNYFQKVPNFDEIWMYDRVRNTIDAVGASSTEVTSVVAVLDSAAQITVTFDITYTTAQQAILSDLEEFVLAIGVGDDSLSTDNSDKTILIVKQATYTKNTDVPDLMAVSQMGYFDHPTNFLTGTGFTDYIGCVEDGILVETDFTLDKALGAKLEALSVNIVAYNVTTDETFIIQENAVDLTSIVEVPEGGFTVQEINVDTTRGFVLATGDQFNFFKMSTSPLSGTNKPYNLQFGIKADWREWLPLPEADTVFYDNSEIQNGLNKLVSNYAANGYDLRIQLTGQISNGAVTTEYNFRSPTVILQDYDASAALDWTCTIETFNLLGTSLAGNISSTENTRIKVTFDSPTIVVANTALYWGIIRIEQQNNPALNIEELSSERSGAQIVLIPLVGEVQTKKSIGAGDSLVLECLVDFTKLVQGVNYKPSSRFGLADSAGLIGGKLKEDGDDKLKENADNKIVE